MSLAITGQRFGRWEVVGLCQVDGKVECKCDCGVARMVNARNLQSGKSTSCGCKTAEWNKAAACVVGGVKVCQTRAYFAYATMKSRCFNKNFPKYKRYGARGITVCDRWRESFVNFLEDMGMPPDGHTLDRINNDGNYCPENCRWATPKEQGRNKSDNRTGIILGESMCVAEASERFGVKYRTIMSRMNRGLTLEQAVFYESGSRDTRDLA